VNGFNQCLKNLSLKPTKMKSKTEATAKVTICRELFKNSSGDDYAKNIEYDLSRLKNIIECGGMNVIVSTLRDIHHSYAQLMLNEAIWGKNDLDTRAQEQLFYLKELADDFDYIYSEAFEPKEKTVEVYSEVV
jgi:hypothetical protein